MSKLRDIINASESPQNLRKILEALGSDWRDYILMRTDKNRPFWGSKIDPNTGERVMGYEINPNAVEYGWDDHTEEEINIAVERMYWEENFEL